MSDVIGEELRQLLRRVDGARRASLVGTDGLAIATAPPGGSGDEDSWEALATDYAALLRRLSRGQGDLSFGEPRELLLRAEQAQLLLMPVSDDCFLVLLLGPQSRAGQAAHLMRGAGMRLREELG
jgi:predicted regulator of Ras-like GTPase activity (Roadblock/LC7/MglB family)